MFRYKIVDTALQELRTHGCVYDAVGGWWTTATGERLSSDPVEARRILKCRTLAAATAARSLLEEETE